MSEKRFFRLFACCIPVKGARRSIICDVQRGEYIFIPNGLYEVLTLYKNQTVEKIKESYNYEYDDVIDEYFNELVKKELGFWTEDPHLFPDINLEWKSPRRITNSIIDIDENSQHDYIAFFKQLDDLGCESLQFRFYDFKPFVEIQSILNHLKYSRLRSIELLLLFNQELTEEAIRKLYDQEPRVSLLIVHSSLFNKTIEIDKNRFLIFSSEIISSSDCCGKIKPDYFSVNMQTFTEAHSYNTCLNRKISMDVTGNIKNCPSMEKSFGELSNTTLQEVINQEEFKSIWNIHKDQIDTCKDCEFRYICTDCRVFLKDTNNIYSKPLKCNYNPYLAVWE